MIQMKALDVGWINTATGKKFYPLKPDAKQFSILDQATSLSNQARYTGHPTRFYSVAMHALIMSYVMDQRWQWRDSMHACNQARAALVHDNAEAYIGDFPRPLKELPEFAFIKDLENKYERMIASWLGLAGLQDLELKALDYEMCAYEAPLIFDRMHPDWTFAELRASPSEQAFIRREIERLTHLSPLDVRCEYIDRFTELWDNLERYL